MNNLIIHKVNKKTGKTKVVFLDYKLCSFAIQKLASLQAEKNNTNKDITIHVQKLLFNTVKFYTVSQNNIYFEMYYKNIIS